MPVQASRVPTTAGTPGKTIALLTYDNRVECAREPTTSRGQTPDAVARWQIPYDQEQHAVHVGVPTAYDLVEVAAFQHGQPQRRVAGHAPVVPDLAQQSPDARQIGGFEALQPSNATVRQCW